MAMPGKRVFNLAGFGACAALMAYALYAEHKLLLEPCPLCVFQRIGVIVLGILFLLAAVTPARRTFGVTYAVLIGLVAATGAGIAGRHVWLQSLAAEEVPACGPGLDYIIDSFPLSEALRLVFSGSGECAAADWHFLGLSMPAWVLTSITILGAAGVWNNLRRQNPRS